VIEEVLELIVDGKIVDKREIALEAGIQIETLDHVIDLLCQNGYLRLSEMTCQESPSCAGCSHADSCKSSDKLGRALFVTEKGKQFVKARRKKKE
jgi:predicted transcriptional regulator